jgi:hypothetical protein
MKKYILALLAFLTVCSISLAVPPPKFVGTLQGLDTGITNSAGIPILYNTSILTNNVTDTNITSTTAANGQALVYNASQNQYQPGNVSSSGNGGSSTNLTNQGVSVNLGTNAGLLFKIQALNSTITIDTNAAIQLNNSITGARIDMEGYGFDIFQGMSDGGGASELYMNTNGIIYLLSGGGYGVGGGLTIDSNGILSGIGSGLTGILPANISGPITNIALTNIPSENVTNLTVNQLTIATGGSIQGLSVLNLGVSNTITQTESVQSLIILSNLNWYSTNTFSINNNYATTGQTLVATDNNGHFGFGAGGGSPALFNTNQFTGIGGTTNITSGVLLTNADLSGTQTNNQAWTTNGIGTNYFGWWTNYNGLTCNTNIYPWGTNTAGSTGETNIYPGTPNTTNWITSAGFSFASGPANGGVGITNTFSSTGLITQSIYGINSVSTLIGGIYVSGTIFVAEGYSVDCSNYRFDDTSTTDMKELSTGTILVTSNGYFQGVCGATNGFASWSTNQLAPGYAAGWTNLGTVGGITNRMYANVIGTSGSIVYWGRTGANGVTPCGFPIFTNTVSVVGQVIPVGVNCGIQINSGVGVTITPYSQGE